MATYEQEDNPMDQFPIDSSSYKITDEIAVGVSAVVYKAVCVPMDSTIVAIKAIDRDKCTNDFDNLGRTMSLVSHPNMLRAHCSFTVDHHLWVETLNALSYLHKGGHIHGDVKAGNILLDSNGCVKLADFGASATVYMPKAPFLNWEAPEMIKSHEVSSFETDIWCFGITALVSTKTFSEAFEDMVTSCLDKDPSKRPSADELLKHPFFEGCKDTSEFLVEHLLHGLPSVEERFRASKIVQADGQDCSTSDDHKLLRLMMSLLMDSAENFDDDDKSELGSGESSQAGLEGTEGHDENN
ncbi:hypothetical protein F3Y22_tig00116958pilonHSYRG00004 [Hibiscus syriacus]|uniref:Protein kinase domain-containing protein n=1 Tax=Hibiscus syriacus TaxID=106335 RepID=A0A6A2WKW6_HIBSY|nr:hypothetical protein F3Y22_tig00116958pilonHSYRG00004 [Hibiscus syriacus]